MWTDGPTDMTKLKVAFRSFEKTLKSEQLHQKVELFFNWSHPEVFLFKYSRFKFSQNTTNLLSIINVAKLGSQKCALFGSCTLNMVQWLDWWWLYESKHVATLIFDNKLVVFWLNLILNKRELTITIHWSNHLLPTDISRKTRECNILGTYNFFI